MKQRIKKWIWWSIAAGVTAGGAIAVYLFFFVSSVTETVEATHEPMDRQISPMRAHAHELEEQEPFSVLILGVDERNGDQGRSDTMIVATVNPEIGSTKLLSVPRDAYTEIVGYGTMDKINHAYAFGGAGMSADTVEALLGIPIDYVVQLNMQGFRDAVDAVGGVTVENELAFDGFAEGTIELNGEQALDYIRMRKEDPRGDFGRQDRQKLVIDSLLRKTLSVNSLLNYKELLEAVGDHVKTNMTFDEMIDIQRHYRYALSNIEQLTVEGGHGEMIGEIWYYRFDETELQALQEELQTHLKMNQTD